MMKSKKLFGKLDSNAAAGPQRRSALSIVLDTNVVVSALLRPLCPPGKVLDLVLAGAVAVAFDNHHVFAEYAEVLSRREFAFQPDRVRDLLDFIWRYGQRVQPTPLAIRLPDPEDMMFIEVAVGGLAEALVTGNLRDYPQEHCQGVRVMTPRQWLGSWVEKGEHP